MNPSADSPEYVASQVAGEKLMTLLRAEFPEFEPEWQKHVASWEGEPAGSYMDIAEFARFIDENLFDFKQTATAERAFHLLEKTFLYGDEATRDLIGVGFIEDLQNYSTSRKGGHATILPMLPPILLRVWKEIERQWAGRTTLADVIEAENSAATQEPPSTEQYRSKWARVIDPVES